MVLPRAIRPPNMQRAKSEPVLRKLTRKICLKQRTSKLLGKARKSLKKLKGTKTLYSDFYIGPSTSIALSTTANVDWSVNQQRYAKQKSIHISDKSFTRTSAEDLDKNLENKENDVTESDVMKNTTQSSMKTVGLKGDWDTEKEENKFKPKIIGRVRHISV